MLLSYPRHPADICPVHEGQVFYPGFRRLEHGGADLDKLIQKQLADRPVLPSLAYCSVLTLGEICEQRPWSEMQQTALLY